MFNSFEDIKPEVLAPYGDYLLNLLDAASISVSTIKPSEWAELYRIMGNNTGAPGPFQWKNSPYAREILDCGAKDHPARTIAVMKGVQIGLSTSMIQNLIGYMIAENPNNIMLLIGSIHTMKDAVERIDDVIDSAGLRHKLKSSSKRARKTKSGDTDDKKEFQDGFLMLGLANHQALQQVSIQTMIIDDFDRMKGSTKEAGATTTLVEARTSAFAKKKKVYYVSTPEVEETSNIKPVYLLGDQRKYHIPCPCCDELIVLEWEIESETTPGEMCGIVWELDDSGRLIPESVGYKCQKCGGWFDDSGKPDWLLEDGYGGRAKWIPTAVPFDPTYYSYHISALYAPIYMNGWVYYVRKYILACPPGGKRNESLYQGFVNLCLGQTYNPTGQSASATELTKNARDYEIFTVPEKLSLQDGNGKIVLLTAGSDINGKDDDARLDWEIIAHAESGATYSIAHGSVGTFIPKDPHPEKREHFSYKHGVSNSIWPLFEKIITNRYPNDETGVMMPIMIVGLDAGYLGHYAETFADNSSANVVLLRGNASERKTKAIDAMDPDSKNKIDLKTYKKSVDRRNLYMVNTNRTKDLLSVYMNLNWNADLSDSQPYGFMNFPMSSGGLYQMQNYYSHFEAEHKIVDKNGNLRWIKKSDNVQNHLYDCRLYGQIVVKDIILDTLFDEFKIKNGTWADYVDKLRSLGYI